MRIKIFLLIAGSLFLGHISLPGAQTLEAGLTFSGHLMLNAGYTRTLSGNRSVRFQVLLAVPYLKPAGIGVDLLWFPKREKKSQVYGGLGANLLVARDKGRWKSLPFLKAVAGFDRKAEKNSAFLELWPAFFPVQKKILPLVGLSLGIRHTRP
jgi:hypothetical protein